MSYDASSSGLRLWLRCFTPSFMGLIAYFVTALLLVGVHLLGISLSGRAFPASFNDYLLQGYANFVIQPLMVIINSNGFNLAMTALFWAALGLIFYAIVAYIVANYSDWRNSDSDISVPREGVVIRHPLRRTIALRLLWRLFIGFLVLVLTIGALPLLNLCLSNNSRVLDDPSAVNGTYLVLLNVAVLMVLTHGYVILLRLYLLRTRVFGEVLY